MSIAQVTFVLFVLYQVLGGITADGTGEPHQLISQVANSFTLKMYNAMKEQDGNIFVSPFSLEVLLALLYLGSKGAVQNEIQAVLQLPNECVVKDGFKELIGKAENSKPLEIATKMFGDANFKIKEKFLNDARTYFYSDVGSLDFLNNADEAVTHINSFVAEKTHNKITKLFDSLSSDTVLVLVNVLYFKADWKHTFPSSFRGQFFVTKENSVEVDMMSMNNDFNYAYNSDLGCQILELKYKTLTRVHPRFDYLSNADNRTKDGHVLVSENVIQEINKDNEYSMYVLLPDKRDGLPSLENKLASRNFEDIIGGMTEEKVNLLFPKFKIEKTIMLNDILKKLGMTTMFQPGAANFSGIADGPLVVSEAIQKTYINVDEKGTEAAAATGISVVLFSGANRIIFFRADHPFMFAIVQKPQNIVLFMGRLVNMI